MPGGAHCTAGHVLFASCSEKLQLLGHFLGGLFFRVMPDLHPLELGIGHCEHPHMPKFGQAAHHSLLMDLHIIPAAAMAQIDAELEHRETIGQKVLAKAGCGLALLGSVRGQIEEDQNPHDAIGIEVLMVQGSVG